LTRGKEQFIVNGDFNTPNVGTGWQIFTGSILGWTGDEIEVGYGQIYNPNWAVGDHVH